MSLSTQRHGALYRYKEILYTYQEVHGGMETRSIDRRSTWPSISPQYQHNHEEWMKIWTTMKLNMRYHNNYTMY
jgi:hypothetical protein